MGRRDSAMKKLSHYGAGSDVAMVDVSGKEMTSRTALARGFVRINAAYALKQEHTTGSLEPGKRGDFILLDRDIFAIDPFDLHSTRVLSTYLDGQEVYAAKGKGAKVL